MRRSNHAGMRKCRKSTFGCVYKLRRRDGSQYENWFVRFVEAGKRVQRGGFATKDAANDFLASQRVEQSQRQALGLPALQRISTSEAIDKYPE